MNIDRLWGDLINTSARTKSLVKQTSDAESPYDGAFFDKLLVTESNSREREYQPYPAASVPSRAVLVWVM